jgi:hypothetical protein
MSPRRNRPSRSGRGGRVAPAPPDPGGPGVDEIETWGSRWWRVRRIPGAAAVKAYRCPGCDQEIRPGVPHLVAWPDEIGEDSGGREWNPLDERRHWHTGCWRARDRRRPIR